MPLLVCATPIGNLEDITLRVLTALREVDLVLCEDTRRTRILLDRHGVAARLLSYHEHNEAQRVGEVLPRLEGGETMALVTDAGLPGISDPGIRLIAAARAAEVVVNVLPGPSAIETALAAAAFEFDRYQFVGYLPRGKPALTGLWEELSAWPHAAVAFESPHRLPASLASLAQALPDRGVAVCRELTKAFEEVVRGPAAEVAARFESPPKGEVTVVLAPFAPRIGADREALEGVTELVEAGTPRGLAAEVVGRLTGIPRNRLYRGSLPAGGTTSAPRRQSRPL